MRPTDIQDCVIVGGGPAGLTAALYLGRFLRSVTVIDSGQSRAAWIPRTHNIAGFPDGIAGSALLARIRRHARTSGATLIRGDVRQITRDRDGFVVTSDKVVTHARNVILACGVVNHRPPLSPADHDRGVKLGLIRYCPVCDGYESWASAWPSLATATTARPRPGSSAPSPDR